MWCHHNGFSDDSVGVCIYPVVVTLRFYSSPLSWIHRSLIILARIKERTGVEGTCTSWSPEERQRTRRLQFRPHHILRSSITSSHTTPQAPAGGSSPSAILFLPEKDITRERETRGKRHRVVSADARLVSTRPVQPAGVLRVRAKRKQREGAERPPRGGVAWPRVQMEMSCF